MTGDPFKLKVEMEVSCENCYDVETNVRQMMRMYNDPDTRNPAIFECLIASTKSVSTLMFQTEVSMVEETCANCGKLFNEKDTPMGRVKDVELLGWGPHLYKLCSKLCLMAFQLKLKWTNEVRG